MEEIKKHFLEAKQILDIFLSGEEHFRSIEAAGKLMVHAVKQGNKIISCGNML